MLTAQGSLQPIGSSDAATVAAASAQAKAASTPMLPALPAPSGPSTSFPFTAAMADRHFKFELPRPRRFTKITADSDICAWLLRVQEYLTIAGIDASYWVVFASNYLDGVPLQLWESCKMQLHANPELLYSWSSFKLWCTDSFSMHDTERHALQQVQQLRQTGSVYEYKAAHNLLAAKTTLPVQLCIYWWECGLKPEIAAMVKVEPFTYKGYDDIDKAQSAACAYGAASEPPSTTTTLKRQCTRSGDDSDRSDEDTQ